MNKLTIIIIAAVFLAVMNIISFSLMAHDKRSAQKGRWRISEKTLFLSAAFFGGLGGVLGMQLFRHKTQHWYFKVFFPVFLIIQLALIGFGAYCLFMA